MSMKVLVINPGSTSTKIAVFEGKEKLFDTTLLYSNARAIGALAAAADGKIAVELAPSASFVPADKFSVSICTVPNAAAKSINFNVRRSQRHLATLRTVENQDGTVTFVADYSRIR